MTGVPMSTVGRLNILRLARVLVALVLLVGV
jgi:hypothetical protein